MTQPRLRLGVVGANPNVGWAARTHMPALAVLPEFELAAVCTTKQESAEAAAQKYEAARAYWNFHELVADPNVDVVDVCVKVPYHHEIVMAALEAGKHVYCEWPLGATTAQAEAMARLAKQRRVRTMVGLQARAAPSILYLRQLIRDGYVGKVVSATLTQFGSGLVEERAPDATWRADRANGAHTLSISAGHALDAFCFCLEWFDDVSAVVGVQATQWPLKGGGTVAVNAPDHVTATGHLRNGTIATIAIASVPWHGSGCRLEIYGTEGTLVGTAASNIQATGLRLRGARRGDAQLADLEVPTELHWVPPEVPAGTPMNVGQMMRRFASGIVEGADAGPAFEDAVRTHRLLDALERSSAIGRSVLFEG